jgi:hypothetical protein
VADSIRGLEAGMLFMSIKPSQAPKTAVFQIADALGAKFIVEKCIGIMQCKKIDITMFGGQDAERVYRGFVAPHRKLRIVSSKTLGVALSEVPEKPDAVFQGALFHEARRRKNRALKEGFSVKKVSPLEYIESVYAINMSTPVRQNRPIDGYLADKSRVRDFCETKSEIYGIFDHDGALKAYAHGTLCGEVFVLDRFIGHYSDLGYGIMFLLMFGVLNDMVRMRQLYGVPHWVQHDMYFVSSPGARQFKKEAGFHPYRVRWLWDGQRKPALADLVAESILQTDAVARG